MDTDPPAARAEPSFQAVEHELLGGERRYTRAQVAELAGVDTDLASTLWRALGFADVSEDEVAFTDRDVEALRTVAIAGGQRGPGRRGATVGDESAWGSRCHGWRNGRSPRSPRFSPAEPKGAAAGPGRGCGRSRAGARDGGPDRLRVAAASGRDRRPGARRRAHTTSSRHSMAVGLRGPGRLHGADPPRERERARSARRAVREAWRRTPSPNWVAGWSRPSVTRCMFTADDPAVGAEIARRRWRSGSAPTRPCPNCGSASRAGRCCHGWATSTANRSTSPAGSTSAARPGSVLVDRELAGVLEGDDRWRLRRVPPRPVRGYSIAARVPAASRRRSRRRRGALASMA